MSDINQIGLMISTLDLWQSVSKPNLLSEVVELLLTKQQTASEALLHPWIMQTYVSDVT